MDVVKEDLRVVGKSEEDADDKVRWRRMILSGDPSREQLKHKNRNMSGWNKYIPDLNPLIINIYVHNVPKTQCFFFISSFA